MAQRLEHEDGVALWEARTSGTITPDLITNAIRTMAYNGGLLDQHARGETRLRHETRTSLEHARRDAAVELVLTYNLVVESARAGRPAHGFDMPQISVPEGEEMTAKTLVTFEYPTLDGQPNIATIRLGEIVPLRANYERFATAIRGSHLGYDPVPREILAQPNRPH